MGPLFSLIIFFLFSLVFSLATSVKLLGIPSWFSSSFRFQGLKNKWGKDLVHTLLFLVALGRDLTSFSPPHLYS